MVTQFCRQLDAEHTVLFGNAKGCWLKLTTSYRLDRSGGTTPPSRETKL